jgi:hypothetical protein
LFLFCIVVSNVAKIEFLSVQSVMGFGTCGYRFRRSPFTKKIFYIYKIEKERKKERIKVLLAFIGSSNLSSLWHTGWCILAV